MSISPAALGAAFGPLDAVPVPDTWERSAVVYMRGGLYAARDVGGALTWHGPWRQRDVGDARRAMAGLAADARIPRFIVAHRFAIERLTEFVDWVEHQLLITWHDGVAERWHLTADCHFDQSQVLIPGTPRVRSHRRVRSAADMGTADDFFADPA